MTIESKAATHVGMVRELNEDSYVENPAAGLWAVADGMGGHEAGEVASKAVVDALATLAPSASFQEALANTQHQMHVANATLVQQSINYPRDRVPGTTVAALLIYGAEGAVIWAGDSRVYRKRGDSFQQVSRDHSHVQDLVDRNLIREDEAESHPMANVITRAVGIEEPMEFDTVQFDMQPNDQFLLCSDGLSRLVQNQEMDHILENHTDDEIVQSLLHTALVRGAPDNVTLIYVKFLGADTDPDIAPTVNINADADAPAETPADGDVEPVPLDDLSWDEFDDQDQS